jgi:hypothetical protein
MRWVTWWRVGRRWTAHYLATAALTVVALGELVESTGLRWG